MRIKSRNLMYSNLKINIRERQGKHQHFGSLKFLISVFLMFSFFFLICQAFFLTVIFYFRNKNHMQNKIPVPVIEIINPKTIQIFLYKFNCLKIKVYTLVQIMCLLDLLLYFKNGMGTNSWKLDNMCNFLSSCVH